MKLAAYLCLALVLLPSALVAQDLSIVGVRVFDGERVMEGVTVNVSGGLIEAVGPDVQPRPGVARIEGKGATLIPGLIDAHTHVARREDLVTAVSFGVTTELDMFTPPQFAAWLRLEQADGKAHDRADVFSCGIPATAPGGHCTQFGLTIPTLVKVEDATAFVDARIQEGSDYIKLVYDDLKFLGLDLPTLSRETMTAVVKAAKARGKLTVAHIGTQRDFRHVVEAGIGGLVHTFCDAEPETATIEAAVRADVFVVPTLSVISGVVTTSAGAELVKDARIAPFLTKEEVKYLEGKYPGEFPPGPRYEHARASVTRLVGSPGTELEFAL